jgi:hypothetical protein
MTDLAYRIAEQLTEDRKGVYDLNAIADHFRKHYREHGNWNMHIADVDFLIQIHRIDSGNQPES